MTSSCMACIEGGVIVLQVPIGALPMVGEGGWRIVSLDVGYDAAASPVPEITLAAVLARPDPPPFSPGEAGIPAGDQA